MRTLTKEKATKLVTSQQSNPGKKSENTNYLYQERSTDPINIKTIIREYYEQLYAKIFDIDEMNISLKNATHANIL